MNAIYDFLVQNGRPDIAPKVYTLPEPDKRYMQAFFVRFRTLPAEEMITQLSLRIQQAEKPKPEIQPFGW